MQKRRQVGTTLNAVIDFWLKEVAPPLKLRQRFAHDLEKWPEFKKRYVDELQRNPPLAKLGAVSHQGDITLIYVTKSQLNIEAVVLKQMLDRGN